MSGLTPYTNTSFCPIQDLSRLIVPGNLKNPHLTKDQSGNIYLVTNDTLAVGKVFRTVIEKSVAAGSKTLSLLKRGCFAIGSAIRDFRILPGAEAAEAPSILEKARNFQAQWEQKTTINADDVKQFAEMFDSFNSDPNNAEKLQAALFGTKLLLGVSIGAFAGGPIRAGVGAATAATEDLIERFQGALLYKIFKEPIDFAAKETKEGLTQLIMWQFPTLTEKTARSAANGVTGFGLMMMKLGSLSKKAFHPGSGSSSLKDFMVKESHAFRAARALSGKPTHDLLRGTAGFVKGGLPHAVHDAFTEHVESLPSSAYEQTSGIPGDAFSQLLSHIQKESIDIVQEKSSFLVKEGVKTTKKLLDVKENPDHTANTQEWKKIIEAEQTRINYQETGELIGYSANIGSTIATFKGNPRLAYQLFVMAQAAPHVWNAIGKIVTSTPAASLASAAASGASAGSVAGPYFALASTLASVAVSLFAGSRPDPVVEALNQWGEALSNQMSQGFYDMSQLVAEVGTQIIDRLDGLDYKIDHNLRYTLMALSDVRKDIHESTALSEFRFDILEDRMKFLQSFVGSQLKVLITEDLRKAFSVIEQLSIGKRSIGSLEESDLKRYADTLGFALIGTYPPTPSMNGCELPSFTYEIMNDIWKSASSSDLPGYAARFIEEVLKMPLPAGICAEDLPNRTWFLAALERYSILRSMMQDTSYDIECKLIDDIIDKIDRWITFAKFIQSKELWDSLITNYQTAYESLRAVTDRAFERGSQELSNTLGFTVSLRNTVPEILSLADKEEKTLRNDIVEEILQPHCDPELRNQAGTRRLLLSRSSAALGIKKTISSESHVSEKLDLGESKISLHFLPFLDKIVGWGLVQFQQKNGPLLFMHRFELIHQDFPTDLYNLRNPEFSATLIRTQQNYWEHHAQVFTGEYPPFGAYSLQFDPSKSDSATALQRLIQQELVRRRKAIAASLFSSPEYKHAKEGVEASINAIQALAHLAGIEEEKRQEFRSWFDTKELITSREEWYMRTGAEGTGTIINPLEEGRYAKTASHLLSLMPASANNPITAPIERERNKLSLFVTQFQPNKKIEKEEPPHEPIIAETEVDEEDTTQGPTETKEKNPSTEQTIAELRAQNAKLLTEVNDIKALLKQILANQNK